MSLCRLARGVTSLVFDAVEAVVYLFDWSDPADKMWADARDRLADTEAEEEVAEPADNYQLYECTQPTCGCHEDSRYAPLPHISTAFPPSSPAPASAGDEPPSRSVPAPDVEREGIQQCGETWHMMGCSHSLPTTENCTYVAETSSAASTPDAAPCDRAEGHPSLRLNVPAPPGIQLTADELSDAAAACRHYAEEFASLPLWERWRAIADKLDPAT